MKVSDLIKELQKHDPELPVCFSTENYVEEIASVDTPYIGPYHSIYDGPKLVFKKERKIEKYLLIGDFGDMIYYTKQEAT